MRRPASALRRDSQAELHWATARSSAITASCRIAIFWRMTKVGSIEPRARFTYRVESAGELSGDRRGEELRDDLPQRGDGFGGVDGRSQVRSVDEPFRVPRAESA